LISAFYAFFSIKSPFKTFRRLSKMSHGEIRTHWFKESMIGMGTGMLYGFTNVAVGHVSKDSIIRILFTLLVLPSHSIH
jgi:hypothetical protein